jgi:predicted  nucleic acid-binding Zn-ribbon protein
MSLSDQIAEMEEELEEVQRECSKQRSDLYNLETDLADVQLELEEAYDFIEYVDATHPELRTAYEAAKILKGDTP